MTLEPHPISRYTEAVKGQRAEKAREWECKGKGPTSKRRKGIPAGPPRGHPHALPVPAKTASGHCPITSARHRPPQRAATARIGRIAAGDTAPTEAAGTHLAAHVAVAPAVRHAVPHAAGALRRAGPAIPRFREPSSRLPRRHAGSRVGDRRLCAQAAAVPSVAHRRQPRRPGGAVGSLDRRRCLRRAAARHRQGGRRSAGRAGRRLAVASLARPAAPVVPLPLPRRPRVPVAQRRNRAALPPIARWSAPRLAQRLSVSVGTIALRLGRAVRARRRAG
ncbi:hypothetical protein CSB96_2187 [Pseudomonas aeruginosa]|nr:hypothetical protein CSB96_2187 [Pseudomonas aeruginosa]